MNKKTISAKPREASKAPLSPRGEAFKSKCREDSPVLGLNNLGERISAAYGRKPSREDFHKFTEAAKDVAHRRAANGDGRPEADIFDQLTLDYITAGADLEPLRRQLRRCVSNFTIPGEASSSADSLRKWIKNNLEPLKRSIWGFTMHDLYSRKYGLVRARVGDEEDAFCEAVDAFLRTVAETFREFNSEAARLMYRLSKYRECFWLRDTFQPLTMSDADIHAIDEAIEQGQKLCNDFEELVTVMSASCSREEDSWKGLPLDVRYSRIRERRDDLRESSSLTAEAALMQLHEGNYMGAKELSKTPGGLKKKLSEAGLLGKRPKMKR